MSFFIEESRGFIGVYVHPISPSPRTSLQRLHPAHLNQFGKGVRVWGNIQKLSMGKKVEAIALSFYLERRNDKTEIRGCNLHQVFCSDWWALLLEGTCISIKGTVISVVPELLAGWVQCLGKEDTGCRLPACNLNITQAPLSLLWPSSSSWYFSLAIWLTKTQARKG